MLPEFVHRYLERRKMGRFDDETRARGSRRRAGSGRRDESRCPGGGLLACGLLLVGFAVAAATPVWGQENGSERGRTLEIEDQFEIRRLGDPRVSPDGHWVAYTVETTSLVEERSRTRIWMVPASGGEAIPMTAESSSASRPRWSPDGKYLSFLSAREGEENQVWVLDRRGGEARRLTEVDQGVRGYEWGPDGRRLVLRIQDPEPDSWAPKPGTESDGESPDDDDEEDEVQDPWVINRLQFKRDYVGYLDERRTHLYLFDLETERLIQITDGPYDDRQPAWSPDGSRLAFVSNRTDEPDANSNTDLWVVSVPDMTGGESAEGAGSVEAGGSVAQGESVDGAESADAREGRESDAAIPRPRRVTSNPGADTDPAWSPDGERLTYVSVVEPEIIWYATDHLAIVPADGGEARLLTAPLDRNVRSPRFSADGRSIWFLLEDSAERHLARLRWDEAPTEGIGSGHPALTRPIDGALSVRDVHLGPAGRIAALIAEPWLPGDVFLLDTRSAGEGSGTGEAVDEDGSATDPAAARAAARLAPASSRVPGLERLTRVNDELLSGIELGEVENVQYASRDGTEIEGFVVFPPDFEDGRRYPTLLRIHGGPVSQYEHRFSFEAQLFAAHGYVVVLPNPRGSSGYGQEFSHAIWADWGNLDYEDVMAGVDYAIERGWADPDRLGVGGWSYGGILTDHVITKTDRFEAAISGASEVLYVSNYGHDHYQLQWELELGLPWKAEKRKNWERISPFNRVEEITTPTLLMGGELDWNVPILNSEQLYQALRRLGRTTQLVVYPGEHHGIRTPSYRVDLYRRYLDWYGRFVKDGAGGESAGGEEGRLGEEESTRR